MSEQMKHRVVSAQVTVKVEGAPPVRVRHSMVPGTMLLPTEVQFSFYEDGKSADIKGWKIKKDGTPGQVWASTYYSSFDVMPDWLDALATAVRPAQVDGGQE
jgi:hypothetical protein